MVPSSCCWTDHGILEWAGLEMTLKILIPGAGTLSPIPGCSNTSRAGKSTIPRGTEEFPALQEGNPGSDSLYSPGERENLNYWCCCQPKLPAETKTVQTEDLDKTPRAAKQGGVPSPNFLDERRCKRAPKQLPQIQLCPAAFPEASHGRADFDFCHHSPLPMETFPFQSPSKAGGSERSRYF